MLLLERPSIGCRSRALTIPPAVPLCLCSAALQVLIVVGMTAASAVLSTLNKKAALKKKWE
jgi:hypothetical protein